MPLLHSRLDYSSPRGTLWFQQAHVVNNITTDNLSEPSLLICYIVTSDITFNYQSSLNVWGKFGNFNNMRSVVTDINMYI